MMQTIIQTIATIITAVMHMIKYASYVPFVVACIYLFYAACILPFISIEE